MVARCFEVVADGKNCDVRRSRNLSFGHSAEPATLRESPEGILNEVEGILSEVEGILSEVEGILSEVEGCRVRRDFPQAPGDLSKRVRPGIIVPDDQRAPSGAGRPRKGVVPG